MIIKNADITKLEDGTEFYVVNGNWAGILKTIRGIRRIYHIKGSFIVDELNNKTLDIEVLEKSNIHTKELDKIKEMMDKEYTNCEKLNI